MTVTANLLHAVLTACDVPPAIRDLDAPARHLYASLICHAHPTPGGLEAAVTVSQLSLATGMSDRSIRRYLNILQNAGLVFCIREAGRPSRYRLAVDPGHPDPGHHVRGCTDPGNNNRGAPGCHDPCYTDRGHHNPGHSDTPGTEAPLTNKQDTPVMVTGVSCHRDRGSTLPPEPPFPTYTDHGCPAHPDYDIDDDKKQEPTSSRARGEMAGHGDSPLARLVEVIRPYIRSYPGARDLEEMDRWLRLAAGDFALILQAIADGLHIFQRDNPGDLPRCARFYSGFVEKAVDWARARRRRHVTRAYTRPAPHCPASRTLPTNRSTVRGVPREVDAGYERYARVLGAPQTTGPQHGRPAGTVRGVPREVDDHYVRYARVLG